MLTHQSMSVAASPRERGAHWLAILVVVALIVTGLNMAGEDFSAKVDRCIGRSKIRRSLFTEFALLLLWVPSLLLVLLHGFCWPHFNPRYSSELRIHNAKVVVWIFILLVLPFSYFITAITLSGTVLADIETARDYFADVNKDCVRAVHEYWTMQKESGGGVCNASYLETQADCKSDYDKLYDWYAVRISFLAILALACTPFICLSAYQNYNADRSYIKMAYFGYFETEYLGWEWQKSRINKKYLNWEKPHVFKARTPQL